MIGVGAILNKRFTLEMELGRGGMGTVYRATDTLLGRNVAIKLLKDAGSDEDAQQIRLEAQVLARLVHDKIVRLYDFGDSAGTYFLIMEEVDGPSFAGRWRALSLGDRLRICGEVAEALDYAHVQGVIHRDIKPGNVLLTSSDDAKLSDFGLSLLTSDRGDPSGTIRGTPRYMSPEQAQGKLLDHRADLYSVGVMLYECSTGDVPFDGNLLTVIDKQVNAQPVAPRFRNPELSSTLENLILSLLEKNPSKRPASANVIALELHEEAERARRLDRINPGLRRSNLQKAVQPPPSSTLDVSNLKVELLQANGTGPADSGGFTPSVTGAPPSANGSAPALPKEAHRSSQTSDSDASGSPDHPVAREMLTYLLATPIVISPAERYLCGHYLAYLLGGSRRRGIFLRRRLDERNGDRARLLLAMTWLSGVGPTHEAIERASQLLEDRSDVRRALTPVVVLKYLNSRDTAPKRQRFRMIRQRLLEASLYAQNKMVNAKGELNPGLMPRNLDDLALIAPPRDTLDAHRVSLWNRLAEVWRRDADFRRAVLRYSTRFPHTDTGSADLWPEVVYPLIERAHWQRTFRPRLEALWDFVAGRLLHVPVAGVRLDRMMVIAIPLEVAEQLDDDLSAFVDGTWLDEADSFESQASGQRQPFWAGATIPREEPTNGAGAARAQPRPFWFGGTIPRDQRPGDDDGPRFTVKIPLSPPEPFLFSQRTLHDMWEGAMRDPLDNAPPARVLPRTVAFGPYELAVLPTVRGRAAARSAVRVVLQGMQQGKEIELFTPTAPDGGPTARTVIAIWIYDDASMAVAHLDFQHKERYILWHAPDAHHFHFNYAEELRGRLATLNLEIPDQFDRILTKK